MINGPARSGITLTLLTLVAACTSSTPARVVTVTASPSPPGASTASSSAALPTVTDTETLPSPAASRPTQLPGTCDTLLPESTVFDAVGVDTLPGTDAFVVGKPDPVIHRLAYLNCRYGVTGTGGSASPAIEIGISLYETAADAAERITATVDDYTAHAASTKQVDLDGTSATMLTGGAGAGYDVPTLVAASGQRTVAVSIADSVAAGAQATKDATSLATLALAHTAAAESR